MKHNLCFYCLVHNIKNTLKRCSLNQLQIIKKDEKKAVTWILIQQYHLHPRIKIFSSVEYHYHLSGLSVSCEERIWSNILKFTWYFSHTSSELLHYKLAWQKKVCAQLSHQYSITTNIDSTKHNLHTYDKVLWSVQLGMVLIILKGWYLFRLTTS